MSENNLNTVSVGFRKIDQQWDSEVLNYQFDIYHLSGWLNASAIIEKGEARAIVAEYNNKKILFSIIKRDIDERYWDATSPYGYSGPIMDNTLTQADIDIILHETKLFLSRHGCVSWFIRLHPVINERWQNDIDIIISHGPTVVINLSDSEEEHWAQTQNQHRRGIKKATKSGVEIDISSLNNDNCALFYEIYSQTMKDLNAAEFYFFEYAYFLQLAESLGERLILVTAYHEGVAISSSIYSHCKESGIMQYHLGGSLNDYRHLQSAKLITHKAREWGRQNGYKFLHLGGGLGANLDSLYDYKRGFSADELCFRTHRIVTNLEEYKRLTVNNELTTDALHSDFFPLYRRKQTI